MKENIVLVAGERRDIEERIEETGYIWLSEGAKLSLSAGRTGDISLRAGAELTLREPVKETGGIELYERAKLYAAEGSKLGPVTGDGKVVWTEGPNLLSLSVRHKCSMRFQASNGRAVKGKVMSTPDAMDRFFEALVKAERGEGRAAAKRTSPAPCSASNVTPLLAEVRKHIAFGLRQRDSEKIAGNEETVIYWTGYVFGMRTVENSLEREANCHEEGGEV